MKFILIITLFCTIFLMVGCNNKNYIEFSTSEGFIKACTFENSSSVIMIGESDSSYQIHPSIFSKTIENIDFEEYNLPYNSKKNINNRVFNIYLSNYKELDEGNIEFSVFKTKNEDKYRVVIKYSIGDFFPEINKKPYTISKTENSLIECLNNQIGD